MSTRPGRRSAGRAASRLDCRGVKSDAFRKAAEEKNFDVADDLFVDEPVFRSPAVFKPYEGRAAMGAVLAAAAQVFEEFRYTDQVEDDRPDGTTLAMLLFEARVGDRQINGVDVLRFDGEGKIEELMVMVRPLSGLNALVEAMGEKLKEMGVPT